MSKTVRILVSGAVLLLAAAGVLALTFLGSRSQGPLEQLLSDVGSMVARTESRVAFDLRGPGRTAALAWFDPYRKARARLAEPDRVLIGAYDNELPSTFEGISQLEEALDEPLPLVHIFAAWGDSPEHAFPSRVLETISGVGSVPVVTWEPWLSTFDEGVHEHLPPVDMRDRGGMAAVARGDYDFYLADWFEEAADFGDFLFVRFGHEMNDAYRYPWGPHHNEPHEYVAAFRHVVGAARRAGASNILWVWSPHLARGDFELYYPGDDVVDWVGATVLNYGNVAYWSEWWTFDDIFTRSYDRMTAFKKPIMIAELGTLMAGGKRAPWFEQALTRLPQRLPEVKAVLFFHNRYDMTITQQTLDWAFENDTDVVDAIKRGMATWPGYPQVENQVDSEQ